MSSPPSTSSQSAPSETPSPPAATDNNGSNLLMVVVAILVILVCIALLYVAFVKRYQVSQDDKPLLSNYHALLSLPLSYRSESGSYRLSVSVLVVLLVLLTWSIRLLTLVVQASVPVATHLSTPPCQPMFTDTLLHLD